MIFATVIPSPSTHGLLAVARVALGVHTVECDGFRTKLAADKYERQLNRRFEEDRAREAVTAVAPADRKIPTGFYTDAEAQ